MNLFSLTLNPKDEDIIHYDDGPLAFFEKDDTNQLWFLWAIDITDSNDVVYLCYPVKSKEDFASLFNNEVSVQTSLSRFPCYLGTWDRNGDLSIVEVLRHFTEAFIQEYLPNTDVYFSKPL